MMTDNNNWIIHKHILDHDDMGIDGYIECSLPLGARILTTQVQREQICIWYKWDLVAKNDEVEKRAFIVVGTGWEIDYDKFHLINYLGTVQLGSGILVFHIFEVEVK